jgi:hypothetical protein
MRNQFYGDRKDVLKWTNALRLAGADRFVLYVAMLRPDKEDSLHGCDFSCVRVANDQVVKFFENVREKLTPGTPRNLTDISRLLPGRIELVHGDYVHRDRKKYFDAVRNRLGRRTAGERYVVLLDPDNGISGRCPRSEHVCGEELLSVWSAMTPDDVLLVYQHRFRNKNWKQMKREILSRHLQVPLDRISPRCEADVPDVCFFEIDKNS